MLNETEAAVGTGAIIRCLYTDVQKVKSKSSDSSINTRKVDDKEEGGEKI